MTASKTLLVDQSAFAFTPSSDAGKIQNACLFDFLHSAQNDFKIMICGNDSDLIKARLQNTDLCEAINPEYKKDQSFLKANILSYEEIDNLHIDVVIAQDTAVLAFIDSHDFLLSPQSLHPDYYHHFIETYEDNHPGFLRAMASLATDVGMFDIRLNRALSKIYADPEKAWALALQTDGVRSLLTSFATARHTVCLDHPQDKASKRLRDYFNFLAAMPAMPDITANDLLDIRKALENELELSGIESLVSNKTLQENLIAGAVQAIERIVREAPRLN